MSADTFSTDGVGVLLMGTGNDSNTWGSLANSSVFQILVDALTNTLSSSVTGGTLDLSGSPPPAASSQVHYAGVIFTGVLGSNQLVKVPNLNKWWLVQNATSGAFTLKFQTPSGSASTAIPQNSGWQVVQCDAANNIVVWPFNTVQAQMPNGTKSLPAYSFVNETNSGFYRNGSNDIRLSVNNGDLMKATAAHVSGLLPGLGATSPDLAIVNHSGTENTKRDITCSEATLVDSSGNAIRFTTVSVTIDYSTTGANALDTGAIGASTAYFEWLISDGTNIAGLASTSSTLGGLTLPAGYTFAKRVGANFTDGSSHLLRVRQLGKRAQYVVTTATNTANMPLLASGSVGSTSIPTWVAVPLAGFAPTTATLVSIVLSFPTSGASAMVAPNAGYGAITSSSNPPPLSATSNVGTNLRGDILLETTSLQWASNNANDRLYILGWEDAT